jgi:Spy/CpxP family protein refolding chaperone
MKKLTTLAVAALLGLAMVSTTASADPAKGQKIYQKFFKVSCGMTGAKFAKKKDADDWTMASLKAEIGKCTNPDMSKVTQDLLDFMKEYAKDSGNVPSC